LRWPREQRLINAPDVGIRELRNARELVGRP